MNHCRICQTMPCYSLKTMDHFFSNTLPCSFRIYQSRSKQLRANLQGYTLCITGKVSLTSQFCSCFPHWGHTLQPLLLWFIITTLLVFIIKTSKLGRWCNWGNKSCYEPIISISWDTITQVTFPVYYFPALARILALVELIKTLSLMKMVVDCINGHSKSLKVLQNFHQCLLYTMIE